MLDTVRDEFDKRTEEIDALLAHVDLLSGAESRIASGDSISLVAIISSSICLMIYNQVESTAFSCVEAIYDELESRKVSFNKLVPEFKRKILDDSRSRSLDDLFDAVKANDIGEVIARASLNLERVFNGNIDARKLREVLRQFNLMLTPPPTGNRGEDLFNIKTARQKLAHGGASFERYGRGLTVTDLRRIVENVREYLDHLIGLTETYLESKSYLAEPDVA